MLARYGRPLFNEQVEAWQYGPVVPSVYHAVKHFKSSPVIGINAWVQHFTPEEYEVMNHVADTYGPYNGVVLSAATHQPDTPWAQTWYAFGRNAPISNDIIENFYSKILQQPTHTSL